MFNNSQLNLAVFFDNSFDDLKNLSKGVFVKNLYAFKKNSNPFHFIQKVLINKKGKGETINDIHIIAHGNNDAIFFGNYKFDLNELKKAKINLENLNLKKIVLWVCGIGDNKKFIEELGQITGADIFYSEKNIDNRNPKVYNSVGNFFNFSEIIYSSYLRNWDGSLSWAQIGSDIDGEAPQDQSGQSISLSKDGSIIAVGSPQNDNNGSNSGSVKIYKNNNDSWEQIGSNIYGETTSEQLGGALSLSNDGNVIAIGAERKNSNLVGNKTGVVRVYKNNNDTWEKIGSDITGESNYDYSGSSVSLSSDGSIVAIGATKNDGKGPYSGHVRVYKNNNDRWDQIGEDIDGDNAYNYFGKSVDLSSDGSIVAIGAHKNNGDKDGKYLGQVKVLKNVNNIWTQIGNDIYGLNNNDHAGAAVSISADGSTVAVGSYGNDDNGDDSGQVRVFKNKNDSWEQIGNDINGSNVGDNFGKFLSLSDDGHFLIVGAPNNSDYGSNSGQVRVFQNNNGSWDAIGSSIEGEAAGDVFGSSTAISITEDDKVVLALGAPQNDGNGSNSGHVRIFKFDEFDPTLRESNPSPGQQDISVTFDISLLFSEYVSVGTGNIYIKKYSDDSLVETIDVQSNQISGSGTKTIIVDTKNKLESTTKYYIQIEGSAFQDLAGNSYEGITDKTTLSFTTADVIPPILISSNPKDNDVDIGVRNNIELTFSENIDVESGDIEIRKSSDNSLVESIDVQSSQISGSGTNVITIDPTNDFESTTEYYIHIDATAFDDSSGNSFAGINDKTSLSFTSTDVQEPTLTSFSPEKDATQVAINSNIELTFSEQVDAESGNIYIKKSNDNSLVETIDVQSSQVSGSGTNVITINPTNNYDSTTKYYVQIDASGFDDASSNSFAGINDKSILTFTSEDITPPILRVSSPIDNATQVAVNSNIELTFSEAVDSESGNIYIKKSVDDSLVETIDVQSNQISGSGTNVITINPTNNYDSTTQYYVQIDSTGFDDASSNSFAGINDKTSLSFTSTDVQEPTLTSFSPEKDATQVAINSNIELTFSEQVDAESGNIYIKKSNDNSLVETIDVQSSQVSGSGTNVITINPNSDFAELTQYYLQIDSSSFDDFYSNSFYGIDDKTTLKFTTSEDIEQQKNQSSDFKSVKLNSSNPKNDETDVALNNNIKITFSDAVDAESGNIYIKKSADNSLVEIIDVKSNQVSGSGTNVITIDPTNEFEPSTQYYVQIDASAFDDSSSNSFPGLSDSSTLDFTTIDLVSPFLTRSMPSDNTNAIAINSNIELTFSENVDAESGNIYIKKSADDSLVETIDVKSNQVSGSGTNIIKIYPTNDFESLTEYYVQIDESAFDDISNNSFNGLIDKTSLSFTTADVISPSLKDSIPTNKATAIEMNSDIELTFSEAVDAESGNVYIKKSDDDSLVETIDVQSSQISGSGTNVIKIDPTNEFESLTEYYIQIDESAFDDSSNNSFNDLNNKTSLSFTTSDIEDPSIFGPSGVLGDVANNINLKENSIDVFTFEANENVIWSINGGDDYADFSIDKDSGELIFINAPDFENPTDINKDRIHEVKIRATDSFNNFSEQFLSVIINDIGEKENLTDNYYKLSYVDSQDSLFEEIFTTNYGNLVNDVNFSRLSNPLTKYENLNNFSIGQTTLDLSLNLDNTSINNGVELTTGLRPLVDGISKDNNYLSYYSLTKNNSGDIVDIKPFNYNYVTDKGARFYDLDDNGSADIAQVKYIDGNEEDNDQEINGTAVLNPTAVASVDLKPIFGIKNSILQVKDHDDSNLQAALNLRTQIISKAETVNQIGYLVLNPDEDEVSYELIKNRGNILLSNLKKDGTPDITDISITKDITLINGQKIVLFEVIDDTLESLLENYSSIEEFSQKFNILDIKNLSNSAAELSGGGNIISISLVDELSNINNLISNKMNNNTIFDFSSLAGRDLKGIVSLTRESDEDSKIGFYVIQNSEGAVIDPITGDLLNPSDSGYKEAALDAENLFTPFEVLSTRDINAITQVITNYNGASEVIENNIYTSIPSRSKRDKEIQTFSEDDLIAPYAINSSGNTFFTFEEANDDGLNHFRNFGDGAFGLESTLNGGDKDFDDLILSFNFELA